MQTHWPRPFLPRTLRVLLAGTLLLCPGVSPLLATAQAPVPSQTPAVPAAPASGTAQPAVAPAPTPQPETPPAKPEKKKKKKKQPEAAPVDPALAGVAPASRCAVTFKLQAFGAGDLSGAQFSVRAASGGGVIAEGQAGMSSELRANLTPGDYVVTVELGSSTARRDIHVQDAPNMLVMIDVPASFGGSGQSGAPSGFPH